MKLLNCYCGAGGNRALWGDEHEITAIEFNKDIAKIYQDFFPNDKVIVADAHQYLLDHYKEYDFIWSSPPCPTHSDIRRCGVHAGQYDALYPDMGLYQQIILLKHFASLDCKWIIENVKPYYEPLIRPSAVLERHYFWSNFKIDDFKTNNKRKHSNITGNSIIYGFDLDKYDVSYKGGKRKILRNLVNPKVGKHILDCSFREQKTLI